MFTLIIVVSVWYGRWNKSKDVSVSPIFENSLIFDPGIISFIYETGFWFFVI